MLPVQSSDELGGSGETSVGCGACRFCSPRPLDTPVSLVVVPLQRQSRRSVENAEGLTKNHTPNDVPNSSTLN